MITQLKASAGSGKTYRLTQTVLNLLLAAGKTQPSFHKTSSRKGYAPSEILAVTFTNKAAAEMKERIISRLKQRALGLDQEKQDPALTKRASILLDEVLRQGQLLNIRTIDSLLQMIVRLFSLELGLSPDFSPVFSTDDDFDAAYGRFLGRIQLGDKDSLALLEETISALIYIKGVRGMWIAQSLRDQVRLVFNTLLTSPPFPLATQQEIDALRQTHLDAILLAARNLETTITKQELSPAANFKKFLYLLTHLSPGDAIKDSVYATKSSLAECLLKASKDKVTPDLENAYSELKDTLVTSGNAYGRLSTAGLLIPFAQLAHTLLDDFRQSQRERDVAHVSGWPLLASQMLYEEGASTAFVRLGARLMHLLIDEFQDTSRDQWSVLTFLAEECLSKGGSLFYVGDVKQAIYGWRGGDARLFTEVADSPALAGLASVERDTLPANWRSQPEIVRFNNAVFTRLGDPEVAAQISRTGLGSVSREVFDDTVARFCQAYGDAEQVIPESRPQEGGYVRAELLPATEKKDLNDVIKDRLLNVLKTELLPRRALADVAILTRTNNEAGQVSSWLLEEGIPVVTENSLRLADHPLIHELLAFLAVLDYPLDNVRFWTFINGESLFGPACGLTAQERLHWLISRDDGPLFFRFQKDFPDLFDRLIKPFISSIGLMTPYDLICEILRAYKTLQNFPFDEIFVRRFMETAHLAAENGCTSLTDFLELWNGPAADEKIPQQEHINAVRVVTMHKAKGLEFPVVIVPFHAGRIRPRNAPTPIPLNTTPESPYMLVSVDSKTPELSEPALAENVFEEINLVYVAWTRAVEELYLFIEHAEEGKAATRIPCILHQLLSGLLSDETPDQLEFGSPRPPEESVPTIEQRAEPALEPAPPVSPSEIPPFTRPMSWLPRLKIKRRTIEEMVATLSFGENQRGSLAHSAIEQFALHVQGRKICPSALSQEEKLQLIEDITTNTLTHVHGVPDTTQLMHDIKAMLTWFGDHPLFDDVCQYGFAERELLTNEGKVLRPDVMGKHDGGLFVLDYKTGHPRKEHRFQVQAYLKAACSAFSASPQNASGFLVYLDGRHIENVRIA